MAIFNFYLKDKGVSGPAWGEGDGHFVGLNLKVLLDKACGFKDSGFSASDFWWDPAPGTIKDHELLVYFVPDVSDSVIVGAGYSIDSTKNGNTAYLGSKPRISEVYVNKVLQFDDRHMLLVNLCLHEMMHNKLAPFDIHTKGGGGVATDGIIYSSTEFTIDNQKLMAKALSKKVPQYTAAL